MKDKISNFTNYKKKEINCHDSHNSSIIWCALNLQMFTPHLFVLYLSVRRITNFDLTWTKGKDGDGIENKVEKEKERENWGTSARSKQQKPRKTNVQPVQIAENRWFLVKIEPHRRRGYQAALNWTTIIISAPAFFDHGFFFDGEFYFSQSGNCRFDDAGQAESALAGKTRG